jgi:hypothetical protein
MCDCKDSQKKVSMKKTLLTGITMLFLATGAAHASSFHITICGNTLVYILGHHGYTFEQIIDNERRELSERLFKWTKSGLYLRGRKCQPWTDLKSECGLQLRTDPDEGCRGK